MLISKYGKGSEKLVKNFEEKFNVKFESEYREFLIKYNGGETPDTSFKNGKRTESIRCLYGINSHQNIEQKLEYFEWQEKQCMPIGEDDFGNFYAIGISEENNGIIYFCDHEKGFSKTKISVSFAEFIKKCKSKEIDEFAKKTPEEIEKIMIEKGRKNIITDALRAMWKDQYEKYKDMVQEEVVL